MKTEIKDEENILEITNDFLNNNNFVEFTIKEENEDEESKEEFPYNVLGTMQISIEELYAAIKDFIVMKDREDKRE